jgi:hypothetical protein
MSVPCCNPLTRLTSLSLPCVRAVTKGDNNNSDDVGLYKGLKYLRRAPPPRLFPCVFSRIFNSVGKVTGYVPYLGYATILMVRFFFGSFIFSDG